MLTLAGVWRSCLAAPGCPSGFRGQAVRDVSASLLGCTVGLRALGPREAGGQGREEGQASDLPPPAGLSPWETATSQTLSRAHHTLGQGGRKALLRQVWAPPGSSSQLTWGHRCPPGAVI